MLFFSLLNITASNFSCACAIVVHLEKCHTIQICIHCTKVVDTKDQKRHSRNCTVKESPGLYEEPDVLSSSDDENEVKNAVRSPARATQAQKDDETSRIINAVHNRQPLWDTRMNKLERSMKIQAELWTEVDEELGIHSGYFNHEYCSIYILFG